VGFPCFPLLGLEELEPVLEADLQITPSYILSVTFGEQISACLNLSVSLSHSVMFLKQGLAM
jgi:hypothetical protein